MKNFIILIIQLCGYAFIFVAILSFLNYLFGWGLGYKGSEVPAEIEFAIAFIVLGAITSALGWFLNKKVSI
jgi:hypothetical protein